MKKTFTLVELIVVIAILAILSVSAFVTLTKWFGKSRDSRRMNDVGVIVTALNTRAAEGVDKIIRFTTGDLTTTTPKVNTAGDIFNVPLNDDVKKGWGLDSLTKLPKDPVGKEYAIGVYNSGSRKGLLFTVGATLENNPDTGEPEQNTYFDGNYAPNAISGVTYSSLLFQGSYTSSSNPAVILQLKDKYPKVPYDLNQ